MSANFPLNTRRAEQSTVNGQGQLELLRVFYLRRLHVIIEKVRHYGSYLVASDRRMVLLNRALLSTFRQCGDLGVEREARRLLGSLRGERNARRPPESTTVAPL